MVVVEIRVFMVVEGRSVYGTGWKECLRQWEVGVFMVVGGRSVYGSGKQKHLWQWEVGVFMVVGIETFVVVGCRSIYGSSRQAGVAMPTVATWGWVGNCNVTLEFQADQLNNYDTSVFFLHSTEKFILIKRIIIFINVN